MPRNGSGTYSLPAPYPFVDGTTASGTNVTSVLADAAAALTGSIAADGQTTVTGNLTFNNTNLVNVGTISYNGHIAINPSHTPRWDFTLNGAESGSNAGSDYLLRAKNDAGATLASAMLLTRSNSNAEFFAQLKADKGLVTAGPDAGLAARAASGSTLRATSTNFGACFINDNTNAYFASTNSGGASGDINAFRPYVWNLTSGVASIDLSGAGANISNSLITTGPSALSYIGAANGFGFGFANSGQMNIYSGSSTSMLIRQDGAAGFFAAFFTNNGASANGSIQASGGGMAYNVASDYRLKDVFGPFLGTHKVDKLKVHSAAWKSDPGHAPRPMMLAHELQEVAPWAITGVKDACDESGNIVPQQVDYLSLIPLLIAKIQELTARVAELEAR